MSQPPGSRLQVARRAVLVVSVLDDVPALDGAAHLDAGLRLPGGVLVPWDDVVDAVDGDDPVSAPARRRVAGLLRNRAVLPGAGPSAPDLLAERLVAVALPLVPAPHPLRPGARWPSEPVLGGVLAVGPALRRPEANRRGRLVQVDPLDAGTLAGLLGTPAWDLAWACARRALDEAGVLAADRLTARPGLLAPVSGVDPLSLLATPAVRAAVVGDDGMRTLSAPMRDRAWYDGRHVDPAYVRAAWTATDVLDRGIDRPVLVTRDEVTAPRLPRSPQLTRLPRETDVTAALPRARRG